MERCARCDVREDEIRLFDAIYEGQMACLCERCSIIENIPIIKKPNVNQLKEAEMLTNVNKRMKNLAGVGEEKTEATFFKKDELNLLEKNPERELPEEHQLNLVEHFHWIIMKHRRSRGLSPGQLAGLIGESEIAIQMIEKNKLPENAEILVKKLEQLFQIKLRKISDMEKYLEEREEEPVLLDEDGREIGRIPEPEPVIVEDVVEVEDPNELDSYEESKELDRLRGLEDDTEEHSDYFDYTKYFPVVKKKAEEVSREVADRRVAEVAEVPEEKYLSKQNVKPERSSYFGKKVVVEESGRGVEGVRGGSGEIGGVDVRAISNGVAVGSGGPRPQVKRHQFVYPKRKPAVSEESVQVRPRVQPARVQQVERSEYPEKPPAEHPPDVDLRSEDLRKMTIDQMRHIHRKKVEVTKQEQMEEQMKIEERQRILEALRERDRMKQEQKKRQEQEALQKVEDAKQRVMAERRQKVEGMRRKSADDIDQYLGGSELLSGSKGVGGEKAKVIDDGDSVEEFDKELV